VVADLEEIGAERRVRGHEPRLGVVLGVADEQRGPLAVRDPHDERVVVRAGRRIGPYAFPRSPPSGMSPPSTGRASTRRLTRR
jgi:hypothetical protein